MPKAIIAPSPPISATPNADIGSLNTAPATPVASPPSSSQACLPPPSPALMASAAAMPSGQGFFAGKAGVSNMR